jgi:tetratricopeptide (TPR) repeat protein
VWLNKGSVLTNLGKPQEALGCYDTALEIRPGYVDAWFSKGVALEKLGKTKEAVQYFQKFIDLAPPHYASRVEHVKEMMNQMRW